MNRVIIVDDDFEVGNSLKIFLEESRFYVHIAAGYKDGLSLLNTNEYDIALFDVRLPDGNGVSLLKWVKKNKPYIDVIMISGISTIETAVNSIKFGAYDFIEKPVSKERLKIILRNLNERKKLIDVIQTSSHNDIITQDKKLQELIKEAEKIALSSLNVLITGESGVGKELFAHLIHIRSERNTHPFIKLNCAAIPESLFESELFGHEKGAFTGATASKKGKFELADRGTLFLDEIGEMPLSQQAKLLRVIEDKEVFRVGSETAKKINVRLICATNCDLGKKIKQSEFREDLFYRLNVINLAISSLRERKNDIPLLASAFLKQTANEAGLPEKVLDEDALEYIKQLEFPGNVRELKNLTQRLFFFTQGLKINKEDVKKCYEKKKDAPPLYSDTILKETMPLNIAKKELEKRYIIAQLEKNNNNVSKTAEALKILPNNLFRKIKELKIVS